MTRRKASGSIALLAGLSLCASALAVTASAQRVTPADAAARLSGNWQMNLELSPQFRPNGGGRQGSIGPVGSGQMLAYGGAPAVLGFQRGGRGGGAAAAPPDPRMMAGNRAIQQLQQVPATMTIAATADSVTFTDPRGERVYTVDDRNVRQDVGSGASLTTKSRWDRSTLRQEFIFDETKVSHAYEVNNEGTRITFTMRIDNFSGGVGRQARAVYDKVQ